MEATTRVITTKLTVIDDRDQIAAAMVGDLELDGRPILVVKGNDTLRSIRIIYSLFARNKDLHGDRFVFSRKLKGLSHRGLFGTVQRITNDEFESYLRRWCVLVEEIAAPGGAVAFKVVDRLPR